MSSPQDQGAVEPVTSVGTTPATTPTPAFNPDASQQSANTVNSATRVNNMSDLKEKAPQVYDAMMLGIATNIINQSKRATERLKQIIREGTRQAQGR